MSTLWQYTVHSFEHHYPETLRCTPLCTPMPPRHPFWRMCWWLCRAGLVRPDREGGYYGDATWHWAFWEGLEVLYPAPHAVSWWEWYQLHRPLV